MPHPPDPTPHHPSRDHFTLGCVSYLNSKPLIDPLIGRADVDVKFAVPSGLLPMIEAPLETGEEKGSMGGVEGVLLPVVDYHASRRELVILPAGCIGCDGPTLTVRIYSQVPPAQIKTLYGDADSHTSVILAQLILRQRYGTHPSMESWSPPSTSHPATSLPQSFLLIGDKVVNAAPPAAAYPYQLDLGEEWHQLTGLPFVFAVWMARAELPPARQQTLCTLLANARARGATMTESLLDKYVAEKHWPRDLAHRYFTEYLKYAWNDRMAAGLAQFYQLAQAEGLLNVHRALRYVTGSSGFSVLPKPRAWPGVPLE
ncbi:MAG: MqnA/MqnD/SBP family protein [Phycisphaerae bacterium]